MNGEGASGDRPDGAPGRIELSVGGLTPEQCRDLDAQLRSQHIDASWSATTLEVDATEAPQVRFLLDRVREGRHGGAMPPGYPSAGYAPPGYAAPGSIPPGYAPPGSAPPGYPPTSPPPGYPPPAYPPTPPYGAAGGYGPSGPYAPYGPYPGYGSYGFVPPKKNNGLAVASLVLGLVASATCYLGIIIGLVAVVLGLVARRQIRERDEQGAGMALAGIIIGGVASAAFAAMLVIGITSTVTSRSTTPRGVVRFPSSSTTIRERTTDPGTSLPAGPTTTIAPSGAVRLEACGRVRSAYRAFDAPEPTDEAILNDAARTLHAELDPATADDIDLILVDALPRAGHTRTGPRPTEVQAALDRLDILIRGACPL